MKNNYIYAVTIMLISLVLQGCGEPSMPEIADKIVKVETPKGKYTTVNKHSGAYGRYQIMPKTAKHYTRKLKINHSQWKKPENQDKIFRALLADNVKQLKENGIEVNAFTVYGCHQQGATGFKCILKNEKMSRYSYEKLRRNLPRKYKHISNEKLRKTWINYWKNKMS
jgi:muramidase (phage lysozyme)